MRLSSINESATDQQLVKLINHEYSPLPQSMRDRFTKLLNSGNLPPHNRSYVMNIARAVQAAIALDDNYSIAGGVLAIADGDHLRGAILFLGVTPVNAVRAYMAYSRNTSDKNRNSGDPADWWKKADDATEIDMESEDFSFLGTNRSWLEEPITDDIAQVNVIYSGILKQYYEKNHISCINDKFFITLADDEFEMNGLLAIIKSRINIKSWAKMTEIQETIDKYELEVVNLE